MDYVVETSFQGSRQLLEFLSAQSPQAAHYLEILSLLSTAITRHRENMVTAGSTKYVSKLFSLGASPTELDRDTGERLLSDLQRPFTLMNDTTDADSQVLMMDETESFSGWDTFDLSQWDDFPFLELDRAT